MIKTLSYKLVTLKRKLPCYFAIDKNMATVCEKC